MMTESWTVDTYLILNAVVLGLTFLIWFYTRLKSNV